MASQMTTWHTEEDFLRDLDNYAEYTRPSKIDEHGQVVCDTPVPDSLRRFFLNGGDNNSVIEISSKEKLQAKEHDSDKDVDESAASSNFEKRDKPKAESTTVNKHHHSTRRTFPNRHVKHQKHQQEEEDEEHLEARGYVPQRVHHWREGLGGVNNVYTSYSQHQSTTTPNVRKQWKKQSAHRNNPSRGRGRGGVGNQNKTIFIPAGMSRAYHFATDSRF